MEGRPQKKIYLQTQVHWGLYSMSASLEKGICQRLQIVRAVVHEMEGAILVALAWYSVDQAPRESISRNA